MAILGQPALSRTASVIAFAVAGAVLLDGTIGCARRPKTHGDSGATSPSASSKTRLATPRLILRPSGRASAQNACFSPDGRTILFTVFHEGYNDGPAGLYRVSAVGGRPVEVADEPDTNNVNLPGTAWNASTNRIAFASDLQGVDEIWTAEPDGARRRRVTRHKGTSRYVEPSFSPDGRWIVFEIDLPVPEAEQVGRIFKLRADRRRVAPIALHPVAGGASTDDRLPNWSPNGDRIVFQRRRLPSEDWDIFTMTPDGRNLRAITGSSGGSNAPPKRSAAAEPSPATGSSSSDTDPSWSPDGRWICYSSDHGGLPAPNIFIVPAEGGRPTRVTRSATEEHAAPSFSPDGRWIAFESHPLREGTPTPASLWRVRAPRLR